VAIPHISVNVIVWTRRPEEKQKMPQGSQREPNGDGVLWESWRGEELSHGEEVGDARNAQRNDEGWFTHPAEIA
jgi:hypothetical protein